MPLDAGASCFSDLTKLCKAGLPTSIMANRDKKGEIQFEVKIAALPAINQRARQAICCI